MVALDLGTNYTGVAVRHPGSDIDAKTITYKHPLPAHVSIAMSDMVYNYILQIGDMDKLVLVEDYAFGPSFMNVLQPEIFGILKYRLSNYDCTTAIIPIPPNSVKKEICGKGRGSKSLVSKALQQRTGKKYGSSHSADAVALLLTYDAIWSSMENGRKRRAIYFIRHSDE